MGEGVKIAQKSVHVVCTRPLLLNGLTTKKTRLEGGGSGGSILRTTALARRTAM